MKETKNNPDAQSVKKLALEISTLRQEHTLAKWKLVLSAIGATLVLCGIVFDRVNTHEQRRHEFEITRLDRHISRMTLITSEFDKMYSDTSTVLYRNRTRTWQLVTHVMLLHQELKKLSTTNPEITRLVDYVADVDHKLAKSTATVDEWSDALALETTWDSRKYAPSPDFTLFFGDNLRSEWQHVSALAVAALSAEYSLGGTHPREKLDAFLQAGAAFQEKLYKRINAVRNGST